MQQSLSFIDYSQNEILSSGKAVSSIGLFHLCYKYWDAYNGVASQETLIKECILQTQFHIDLCQTVWMIYAFPLLLIVFQMALFLDWDSSFYECAILTCRRSVKRMS